MLKRLAPFVAVLLAFAIAASADAAQRNRRAKPEEPPPPPQFKVDVATRSLELTRLASSVASGSTIGKFSRGCALIDAIGGDPVVLHPEDAFRGLRTEDLMRVFTEEAGLAGYKLPDSAQGNLFADQAASKAELSVGAGVTALAMDGCFGQVLMVRMAELEATITIDWQVFDPLEKKLLFRASTSGQAKIRNNQFNDAILNDGLRTAFRDAAKNILADPNFVAAVKDPKGGVPANSNSLFPEATSSAPAAAPTQIPQLALSTAEFRTQVGGLRQQVVTILTPGGTGSGFYISSNLLLTNHHVIDGYTDVKIKFFGGREIAGRVVSSNGRRDIALLQTEAQPVSGLPLRLEPPPETSPVYVIGSPLGQEHEGSISAGIVSGFRDIDLGPMIQSDVGVTFGNSGGPMFDDKGNVIALVDIGIPDDNRNPTQVNLFIPIADALKVLQIGFAPTAAAAK